MIEPKRWMQSGDAPPEIADLLAAARPPRPLDAFTKARSRRRLTATMTAIPAAAGVMFWLKSVALGAVLGSVVTASVVAIKWPTQSSSDENTPRAGAKKSARVTAPAPAAPALDSTQVPEPEPSEQPSAMANVAPAPAAVSNRSAASAASAPIADEVNEKLEREIQLLERARQLMNANPKLALATLDEHRREFGSGTLVLERQFLEVEALLHLGRRDQALARAADLRARAPGSLYERRLVQLLGNP